MFSQLNNLIPYSFMSLQKLNLQAVSRKNTIKYILKLTAFSCVLVTLDRKKTSLAGV